MGQRMPEAEDAPSSRVLIVGAGVFLPERILRRIAAETVAGEPLAQLQYISCAHGETLQELETVRGTALLSLAAFVGRTRLIDNLVLQEER